MRSNYVHSSNSSKIFGNKIGLGKKEATLYIKGKEHDKNNLLLIEVEKQNTANEIIKVTHDGELYLKGKKYFSNDHQIVESLGYETTELNDNSVFSLDDGIVLGNWKIIPKGDKLLIQKQVNGEWTTRQQFD